MKTLKRAFPILFTLIMGMNNTACGSNARKNVSAETAATVASSEVVFTPPDDLEPVIIDNMSDLIQLNGSRITTPITLNKLTAAIEGATYELEPDRLDHYKSAQKMLDETGKLFYNVKYGDLSMLTIISDYNYITDAGDCELSFIYFNRQDFENSSISLKILDKIDFSSSRDDIKNVLGEPNMKSDKMHYFISDKQGYLCDVKFIFRNDSSDEMTAIKAQEFYLPKQSV